MDGIQVGGKVYIAEPDVRRTVNAALATNEQRNTRIAALEAEVARYKRLEALLRDRSDVEDVPDCGDEQRVRPNQAMSILAEWEGK